MLTRSSVIATELELFRRHEALLESGAFEPWVDDLAPSASSMFQDIKLHQGQLSSITRVFDLSSNISEFSSLFQQSCNQFVGWLLCGTFRSIPGCGFARITIGFGLNHARHQSCLWFLRYFLFWLLHHWFLLRFLHTSYVFILLELLWNQLHYFI